MVSGKAVAGNPASVRIISIIAVILCWGIFIACSAPQPVRERDVRISYINLKLVVDYMISRDDEARTLKKQQQILNEKVIQLQTQGKTAHQELVRTKSELKKCIEKGRIIKTKFYNEINGILSYLSKRMEIDYIFNSGDELLYAHPRYDLTEEVIRELNRRARRTAPISR